MSVIFLAGVHGVGKGYLGNPTATTLGMVHCTASQLIREEKGYASWTEGKLVADVNDNQRALISAVHRRRSLGENLLLDGHFTLRNVDGKIVRLGIDVFSGLGLSGCVLLCDDTDVIAKRLFTRDHVWTSPDLIAELSASEVSHARYVCDSLHLPLIVVSSPNEELVMTAVKQVLARAITV